MGQTHDNVQELYLSGSGEPASPTVVSSRRSVSLSAVVLNAMTVSFCGAPRKYMNFMKNKL
jgi:hypothetical protein